MNTIRAADVRTGNAFTSQTKQRTIAAKGQSGHLPRARRGSERSPLNAPRS